MNKASHRNLIYLVMFIFSWLTWTSSCYGYTPQYAGIVIDADTGHVLYGRSIDSERYPASLTKMMTLYLLFDALEKNQVTLYSKLDTSRNATLVEPSKLGLKYKETISIKNAIEALIIKSANDVAVVVAENLSGSTKEFAKLMNKQAKKLGMNKTFFVNPNGLPNKLQKSTVKDLAILARALQNHFPQYYSFFGKRKFTFNGQTYYTHNKLTGKNTSFGQIDGLKTGYINASGFNVATSAINKEGRRLIGVIIGEKSPKSRDKHMINILSKSYKRIVDDSFMILNKPQIQFAQKNTKYTSNISQGSSNNIQIIQQKSLYFPYSDWSIQVGTYKKLEAAQHTLISSRETLESDLQLPSEPLIMEVDLGSLKLYRARLLGFEKKELAQIACEYFADKEKGCVVIEPFMPQIVQFKKNQNSLN